MATNTHIADEHGNVCVNAETCQNLAALNAELPAVLKTVLKYLEHPDVQAMSFALPVSNVARMVRAVIAKAKELDQ